MENDNPIPTDAEMLRLVYQHVYDATIYLRTLRGMALSLYQTLQDGTEAKRECWALLQHCGTMLTYFDPEVREHERHISELAAEMKAQQKQQPESANPDGETLH